MSAMESKLLLLMVFDLGTVKPVLIGHSKKDKMEVLKTGGSLMQV